MSGSLSNYYMATVVPERLRARQCRLCRTPIEAMYDFCFRCYAWRSTHPDLAGIVTYALKGDQSGSEMHRYKDYHPSSQALNNVWSLLDQGLAHRLCASRLVGQPVDAIAVVPSRSHYQDGTQSMLQRLCTRALPASMPLVDLRPVPGSSSDRLVHGDAFTVVNPPVASHVMLIDDTWVSGATTLSAVTALRASGAPYVSVLVLARWLDPGYAPTREFLTAMRGHTWRNPEDVCPFTPDGLCPS